MLGHGATGQFAIGEVGTTTAEIITPDKWYVALSEPVRFKRGLEARYQAFAAFHPNPIIDISWFANLSEPVRQKKGLRAQLHPFETKANITPLVSFGWMSALSEPKRFKRGIRPDLQQFTAYVPNQTTITPFSWFSSLSEPKRFKRGLRPDEMMFLGRGEFVPISYTAILDAIEQGDFFLGVLSQFNIPLTAYVDIITNDPRYRGNLGVIAQAPQSSTIAAIIEPDPVQAAGIISPVQAAGARVAIIVT